MPHELGVSLVVLVSHLLLHEVACKHAAVSQLCGPWWAVQLYARQVNLPLMLQCDMPAQRQA